MIANDIVVIATCGGMYTTSAIQRKSIWYQEKRFCIRVGGIVTLRFASLRKSSASIKQYVAYMEKGWYVISPLYFYYNIDNYSY